MSARITKIEAIKKYGEDIVNKAMETLAEPTSRTMYPGFENPDHLGKNEWAGDIISTDYGYSIQAYYYLTDEDQEDTDSFDWESNVEFEIEETL